LYSITLYKIRDIKMRKSKRPSPDLLLSNFKKKNNY